MLQVDKIVLDAKTNLDTQIANQTDSINILTKQVADLATINATLQDQMITLGRSFERLLDQDREDFTEQVEAVMRTCCREIKRNKCRSETEVMNLACLVRRDDLQRFEETVGKAADPFDDNYAFDFTGPWAPHNFVEMDIQL